MNNKDPDTCSSVDHLFDKIESIRNVGKQSSSWFQIREIAYRWVAPVVSSDNTQTMTCQCKTSVIVAVIPHRATKTFTTKRFSKQQRSWRTTTLGCWRGKVLSTNNNLPAVIRVVISVPDTNRDQARRIGVAQWGIGDVAGGVDVAGGKAERVFADPLAQLGIVPAELVMGHARQGVGEAGREAVLQIDARSGPGGRVVFVGQQPETAVHPVRGDQKIAADVVHPAHVPDRAGVVGDRPINFPCGGQAVDLFAGDQLVDERAPQSAMGQVAIIRAVEFQRAVVAVKAIDWTYPVSLLDLFLSPLFPRVNLLFGS